MNLMELDIVFNVTCYANIYLLEWQSWCLFREQAELMVSFGLVGEAMRVFEELELWNNLIDCYTYVL